MARFFLSADSWTQGSTLDEEQSRHCSQVLRKQAGDHITVFDGLGRLAEARITGVKKNAVLLEIGDMQYAEKSTPEIILAQSIPKGKTMDWIVEKAVELGVSRIIPLITRYTVVKYDANEASRKAEKWQKVAMEACKQCGQNWMPIVENPIDWNYYINRSIDGLKIIASLAEGATSLRELLEKNPTTQQVTILIGPEGDFTSEETTAAISKGFQPVTLGDIVLRTETATMFCLSAIRCRYIDMKPNL